jgi:hypothetical protein
MHAVQELDVLRARARRGRADLAGEADQRVEEGLALLQLGRLTDADEAAARRDVVLQRGLLATVEDVAGGVHERHRAVLREARRADRGGVARHVDGEAVRGAERLDSRSGGCGGGVRRAGGAGEHEHLAGVGGGRCGAREARGNGGQQRATPGTEVLEGVDHGWVVERVNVKVFS